MKPNEQDQRRALDQRTPFTLVTASGDRVKVRSPEHIFLPPVEDEDGRPLEDGQRSDFFEVWGDGRSSRWVAFSGINVIEVKAPQG